MFVPNAIECIERILCQHIVQSMLNANTSYGKAKLYRRPPYKEYRYLLIQYSVYHDYTVNVIVMTNDVITDTLVV